jgi:predicted lipoprotein
MRTISPPSAIAVLSLGLSVGAMGCDPPGYAPFDRSALLSEVTTTLVLPAYEDAETTGAALSTATSALCDAPSTTTLSAAQAAWRDAVVAWRVTQPFAIDGSPAIAANYEANLTTEASIATIDQRIAGTDTIDTSYIMARGGQDKGYFALEYLLFAYPSFGARDDAQTLAALGDSRRCAYARFVAADIATTAAAARSDWDTSFARELTMPDGAPYAEPQTAVNALIDGIANAIDQTRDVRLGRPLGRTARAGGVESPYAGISVMLMEASLESAHHAWSMTPHSIDALLRSRNVALADGVEEDFASARAAITTLESPPLPVPFEAYVRGTDLGTGVAAYAELNDLQASLNADVSSTLGHNVFLRSDGD